MPGVDFPVLRREIGMREVLSRLGFEAVRCCGEQWRGPCPVHGSRSSGSRAFSVNVASGRYCCHKCGSHGNVLELWAAVWKLPLYEAALDLCRALGREVPWLQQRDVPRTPEGEMPWLQERRMPWLTHRCMPASRAAEQRSGTGTSEGQRT